MHVRVGNPLFTRIPRGVYMGVIVRGGLWLRDPRLRALIAPARLKIEQGERR